MKQTQPQEKQEKNQPSQIDSLKVSKSKTIKVLKSNSLKEQAKWESFVQVGLRLPREQIIFLDDLKSKIMQNRNNKQEVLNKNSIIRALVNILQKQDININGIDNEEILVKRIEESLLKL